MSSRETQVWDTLWRQLDALQDALRQSRATTVNSVRIREKAKECVQFYFRVVRAHLSSLGVDDAMLDDFDGPLQELLRYSNTRKSRGSYLKLLRNLRSARDPLEIHKEKLYSMMSEGRPQQGRMSEVELAIVSTLRRLVPSTADSYEQAALDLLDLNRLSYRGAAAELRETLREVLDRLAPDDEVLNSPGFKLNKDTKRPTMKQKARFILRARGMTSGTLKSPEDAIDRIEASASVARSVYTRGSVTTHVTPTREEVLHLKMYVDSVLAELLQIHSVKK